MSAFGAFDVSWKGLVVSFRDIVQSSGCIDGLFIEMRPPICSICTTEREKSFENWASAVCLRFVVRSAADSVQCSGCIETFFTEMRPLICMTGFTARDIGSLNFARVVSLRSEIRDAVALFSDGPIFAEPLVGDMPFGYIRQFGISPFYKPS